MLSIERRQYIFNIIKQRGSITVSELSQLSKVGEETIRRDLNKMASEDLIDKIYGGATIKRNMHRVLPSSTRKVINSSGKQKIAYSCSLMINEGDTIFLDASSTALEIAGNLGNINNLIVITNSCEITMLIADNPGIKVIGIGGTMRPMSRSFVGHSAITSIGQYYADKAFIGCDAVDMITGITDANEQDANIKRAMLNQSTTRILISDKSKINKTSFVSITEFKSIHMIVTDQQLSSEWINFLNTNDVEYKLCNDDSFNL
ncbi:MAG: DeoR/GlpR family DNA-binding transcription regulator [Spirochaetaceae bacterium]